MNKTPGVIVDNHSHILYADIKEMIASAKANSVTEFSITEHVSQFRQARESIKFGSVHSTGRIFQSLEEYREEFRKVDREALGMKIRCGLEVDFSPGYETRVGDFVKQEKWDTLLCSVHELSGGTDFERVSECRRYSFRKPTMERLLSPGRISTRQQFCAFRCAISPRPNGSGHKDCSTGTR